MREGGKSMAQPVVWRLADDDARAAAEVAARAFQDAPLFADAVPDAAERAAFLPLFFVDAVHAAIASGGAWAIGDRADDLAGVALWRTMPTLEFPSERLGPVAPDPFAARWNDARARVVMAVESTVAATPDLPERWRHLETIAVDPPRQRHGLGTRLLRHLLADAADHGMPLVLFTGRPENVPLYRRVGLELAWRGIPPGGRFPLWAFRTPG
jgi:ribosomal protein S18 acetylase RimI-like enzyme